MLRESAESFVGTLDKLVGTQKRKSYFKLLLSYLKSHPAIKIYTLDKLFNPFSTYLSDKMVLEIMFFKDDKNRLLKFFGSDIIDTFRDYLHKYREDAVDIALLLKKHS